MKNLVVTPDATTPADLKLSLINPKPSVVSGVIFEDRNNDGKRQDDEPTQSGMLALYKFASTQKLEFVGNIFANQDGKYAYTLPAPAKYNLTPLPSTFYKVPKSVNITAYGYGANITSNFGYIPEVATGQLTVFVYNDKNENSNRDPDEELIHYQYVQITNQTTGKSWKSVVSESGSVENALDFGNYYFALVPQDGAWSSSYKITRGYSESVLSANHLGDNVYLGAHKL